MSEPTVEILAVTTIKDVCFVDGCDEDVVGVAAYHSSEHRDVVAVWLCELHGGVFNHPEGQKKFMPDATTDVLVQETSRTCRWPITRETVCGACPATRRVWTKRGTELRRFPRFRLYTTGLVVKAQEAWLSGKWLG